MSKLGTRTQISRKQIQTLAESISTRSVPTNMFVYSTSNRARFNQQLRCFNMFRRFTTLLSATAPHKGHSNCKITVLIYWRLLTHSTGRTFLLIHAVQLKVAHMKPIYRTSCLRLKPLCHPNVSPSSSHRSV